MLALAQELTASGDYTAVLVSVEVGTAFSHQPGIAKGAILAAWQDAIDIWLPETLHPYFPEREGQTLGNFLKNWAQTSPRPLVIFINEINALQDQTLIFILRQLRDGYPRRPQGFPHSLGLIGMRDVRTRSKRKAVNG